MVKVAIVGASGYAGAELCRILSAHPNCELTGLFVSARSEDQGKRICDLYGKLDGLCDLILQPLSEASQIPEGTEAVFLATEHKVSHDLAAPLIERGCTVFDLSGAFRLSSPQVFERHYGFAHEHLDLLKQAVYGLGEFVDVKKLQATKIIALPGCYPTASQLALKPLIKAELLDEGYRPSINAVSGVSGAGRKAKLTSSFCEVSLNAYGVFTHRHQPEIAEQLGMEVIFTPHLGNFKRGILATITARLKDGVDAAKVTKCYEQAYRGRKLVRLKKKMPLLQDVQYLPYCDLGFSVSDGYIVICSAIDNVLKGAAAQAVQILNLYYGFDETTALI